MPVRPHRPLLGRLGEWLATVYLVLHGHLILGRRRRVAGVEVDLIARRRDVDALVEVKTRRVRSGRPARLQPADWLVSPRQLRRLRRAAATWSLGPGLCRVVRVDVVEIRLGGPRPWLVHHEDVGR